MTLFCIVEPFKWIGGIKFIDLDGELSFFSFFNIRGVVESASTFILNVVRFCFVGTEVVFGLRLAGNEFGNIIEKQL